MSRQPKVRRSRRIAPRLANGKSRENWAGRLPDYVKRGLAMRAHTENKSISWMIEEWVIQQFGFRRPEYVQPKNPTVEEQSAARGTLRRVK